MTLPNAAAGVADSPAQAGSVPGLLIGALLWMLASSVIIWKRRLHRLTDRRPPTRSSDVGLILLGAGLTLWLGQQLGALALNDLANFPDDSRETLRGTTLLLVGGFAGAAIALGALLLFVRGAGPLPRRTARPTDLLRGIWCFVLTYPFVIVAGLLATGVAAWIARRGGSAPPDELAHDTLRMLVEPGALTGGGAAWGWSVVIGVVVLTPIVEEIIYRGCLQGGLVVLLRARRASHSERSTWAGVVLASVIFAGIHVGVAPWYGLVALFALSLGFGAAYERTGRILVPIVMHAIFNAVNVGIALWETGS